MSIMRDPKTIQFNVRKGQRILIFLRPGKNFGDNLTNLVQVIESWHLLNVNRSYQWGRQNPPGTVPASWPGILQGKVHLTAMETSTLLELGKLLSHKFVTGRWLYTFQYKDLNLQHVCCSKDHRQARRPGVFATFLIPQFRKWLAVKSSRHRFGVSGMLPKLKKGRVRPYISLDTFTTGSFGTEVDHSMVNIHKDPRREPHSKGPLC